MTGVRAVVTSEVTGSLMTGPVIRDRPPLAAGKVRHFCEPIAIVVADTLAEAKAAADRVGYEPLPAVNSLEDALKPDAPLVHEEAAFYQRVKAQNIIPELGTNKAGQIKVRKGDMAKGWAASDVVVEGEYRMPQSDHVAMETQRRPDHRERAPRGRGLRREDPAPPRAHCPGPDRGRASQWSVDKISVFMRVDTQVSPRHWKTVARMTTYMAGNAVLEATDDLIRKLKQIGAVVLRAAESDLDVADGKVFIRSYPSFSIELREVAKGCMYENSYAVGGQIMHQGTFIMRHITPMDPKTGKGKLGPFWTVGTQAMEVEYDTRGRAYRFLRAGTAIDAGKVLNPLCARSQVMGGMNMGLSLGSREALKYDQDGVVEDIQLRTYRLIRFGEHHGLPRLRDPPPGGRRGNDQRLAPVEPLSVHELPGDIAGRPLGPGNGEAEVAADDRAVGRVLASLIRAR